MGKGIIAAALLLVAGSFAAADTIYTDYAAWRAAAQQAGHVTAASLTPGSLPAGLEPGTLADDEISLSTDSENRGSVQMFTDGWTSEVYYRHTNVIDFHQPTIAFAAMVKIGMDGDYLSDGLNLTFGGDEAVRIWRRDYDWNAPAFFGWVGDAPVSRLVIDSGQTQHGYSMRDVQYVAVPLPAAAWGALALLSVAGWWRRSDAANCA